jgi:acyl-CoA synthetase (AMP-forming)/AMP-acid ligase II
MFLEDSAENHPRKDGLFASEKWHTFQEINSAANKLAYLFLKRGLKRGDRVAIYIENSVEYVVSYYAILKAGGTTVALNTESTPDDIAFIAYDCSVRFFVTNKRLMQSLIGPLAGSQNEKKRDWPASLELMFIWSASEENVVKGFFKERIDLPAAMEGEPTSNPDVNLIDLDVASIVYTSGSTGKPRGAVLSHLNIVSNTRSIVDYLELTPDDRIMVVLPFYYIYGKSLLNTHFSVGGSVVIDNRFMYPNVVLQTMQKQEVTGFAGVPSTFTILLRRSNLRTQQFPKLRYLTQAGGAMAPSIQKEVAEAFAPAKLYVMYGATEASARLSYLPPGDLPRKWGSIGKAIPNVELFIADAIGKPLRPGDEGEIVARGSNIMSGYWNHPEETQKVLKNGLYFTGDLGKSDEEGFLFIVGRSKDMIKIGGNRVAAKEIEDALYEHPAVIEAAVLGVPDDVLGEAPKAYLVVKKDHRETIAGEMPSFLQRHLAIYKIPKYYEIRDSLPKNESGKIQKLKLK